ncbi:hypothetical protein RHGRI_025029 [Rhododendron griersonianum]|uniref:Uncharacterized protein n=1 Tax=Rhododendron griersonianum TaxID=479676 RepID=A0AAV6J9I0_9ERIC|nr:hypothetical protein RHGRI_025029 [Rhododendron griersonianum]
MTRRCSHCSNNGHNSRTCPTRGGGSGSAASGGVKLFGVRLTDGGSIIKKSASMGNLSAHYHSSSSAAASPNPGSPSSDLLRDPVHVPDEYLSDDPAHGPGSSNRRAERKKGVPWTEEEHRLFLLGLQKLGKGDWRGISRSYVTSRTPTQVASHAQKYFIRHTNAIRRKRRSSLFDMVPEMVCQLQIHSTLHHQSNTPVDDEKGRETKWTHKSYSYLVQTKDDTDQPPLPEEQFMLPPSQAFDTDTSNSFPSLKLSLSQEFEPMETTSEEKVEEEAKETATPSGEFPTAVPAFFPAFLPIPFPLWQSNAAPPEEEKGVETFHHQVLRPIPVIPKEPVNVDELVGMSQLSLGETESSHREPPSLSLSLLGTPSRPSAFHASTPVNPSATSKHL